LPDMGTVHGCSYKYLGMSVVGGLLAMRCTPDAVEMTPMNTLGMLALLPVYLALWHVCLVNAMVFCLFNLRMGMDILGKDAKTGQIPLWSYLLFPGFFIPTFCYTRISRIDDGKKGVPVATEVHPGWFLGGRYGDELGRKWAGTIDLTCEFPEGCANSTERYMLLPCWDGTPPPVELLDRAATFAVEARKHGDVMVHCAHGRGRSTCMMCACLVKAGVFPTWKAAFEACKEKRSIVKLNMRMRTTLDAWEAQFVAKQK